MAKSDKRLLLVSGVYVKQPHSEFSAVTMQHAGLREFKNIKPHDSPSCPQTHLIGPTAQAGAVLIEIYQYIHSRRLTVKHAGHCTRLGNIKQLYISMFFCIHLCMYIFVLKFNFIKQPIKLARM